ncbi:MAG: hypothetical protein ACI837_000291 [Crocinitomicaceae bacterium]|jgi:hypothetical protein
MILGVFGSWQLLVLQIVRVGVFLQDILLKKIQGISRESRKRKVLINKNSNFEYLRTIIS